MSTEPAPELTPKPRRRRGGKNRRLLAGMVIGALVAVFAFLNLGDVKVDWIFGTAQSPLIIVIAVSFLLGMVVSWLATLRRAKPGRGAAPVPAAAPTPHDYPED